MRPLLFLIAFAPIRLCSFNNGWEEPLIETGGWTGFEADVWIQTPERMDEWCVGEMQSLIGWGAFDGTDPREIRAYWVVNNREVCSGTLSSEGALVCDYTVMEADLGRTSLELGITDSFGQTFADAFSLDVERCSDPDSDVDSDVDTQEVDSDTDTDSTVE